MAKNQMGTAMTTTERMNTALTGLVWDTDLEALFLLDGQTAGGNPVGGGGSGTPGPAGVIPSGFVWQDGKLYWGGGPVIPTVFIADGKKLYVDSVTGELKVM